jgi:50S ribosomal protein L16 3-hydroxylase
VKTPFGPSGPDQFLKEYWQKKPCLIRQAFADFEPLLDGDDLAGLAGEELADSRLISGSFESSDWSVRQGPFSATDFSNLPEKNWTLLVQDVEKHYAPLQALMQQFNFIPNWRIDDLMISFAASGGSVGPHVDQYDVFLLQAEGKRRWQIANTFAPELLADCPLNVLRNFTAEQEWVLEPGDMLYLPPNIAHHGVALEPGMTWSIGCRAPSAADLLQGLGEWLAFADDGGGHFSDPGLTLNTRAGEINRDALGSLRQFMLNSVAESDTLDSFLAAFLSRFRLAHEPAAPPENVEAGTVRLTLSNGGTLLRNPWTRLTWIGTDTTARMFAAGEVFECESWLAEALCLDGKLQIDYEKLDQASVLILTQLINRGHFLLNPSSS